VSDVTPRRSAVRAHLGLGTNVGDRLDTIISALFMLEDTAGIAVAAISSVYETAPWGGVEQEPFLNLVATIATTLTPHELLAQCQVIEAELGRDRTKEVVWGPRTCDIDILTYADDVLETEDLVVPHPRLRERAFVLVPLLEVWAGGTLPDGTRLTQLLSALAPLEGIEHRLRLEDVPGALPNLRPAGPGGPGAIASADWNRPDGAPAGTER
jgi:2-amino-4-hydroxy-6-hydroxymethyldihydropteridine diphosphokinase